ncbi:MAG: hypothetical protein GC192_12220 [Bacteroidetes bacterium]|nr:hypothetical protein [Bacteroidota bacterium]
MQRNFFILTFFCWYILCHESLLMAQVPHFEEVSEERGIADVGSITHLYGNGAAAADFDNDGDIDFYLTTDDGITDRLYENNGHGYFIDVAEQKGIAELKNNRAALWFDYDGDGRLDLVLAGENCVSLSCKNPVHLALYKQLENGQFEEMAAAAGLILGNAFDNVPFYAIGGFAAGDLNGDGFLDLVLSVWGGGIKLFQNNGDGSFFDKTEAAGLTMEAKTPWQAMLYDFNDDGRLDIYCNVDFAPNKLWINQDGTFLDKAAEFGLDNSFDEMGMTMADSDNDGDLDIYITNITRTYQGQGQHNLLYEQQQVNGQLKFKETAKGQGVSQSGWDWGTTFADINNDGRQDLLATNGLINYLWPADSSHLWLNTKAGFVDVSDQCGFNDPFNATTLLAFDMDGDGDEDILQTLKSSQFSKRPVRLYENQLENVNNHGNFINLRPRMEEGNNRYAIGCVVTLKAKGFVCTRLISAGCSFYGQEPAEAFFGLGQHNDIQEVVVKWPNGEVSIYLNPAINQTVTLVYDFINRPTDLMAVLNEGQIELDWKDNSTDEIGFFLYKSETPDFAEVKRITLSENATHYTDEEVEQAKTYYYKVRAQKMEVSSDDSNIARVAIDGGKEGKSEATLVQPNPIQNNNLSIQSYAAYQGPIQLSLFDLTGKLAWSAVASKSTDFVKFDYPIQLPNGAYLLLVKLGEAHEWHKVII